MPGRGDCYWRKSDRHPGGAVGDIMYGQLPWTSFIFDRTDRGTRPSARPVFTVVSAAAQRPSGL